MCAALKIHIEVKRNIVFPLAYITTTTTHEMAAHNKMSQSNKNTKAKMKNSQFPVPARSPSIIRHTFASAHSKFKRSIANSTF